MCRESKRAVRVRTTGLSCGPLVAVLVAPFLAAPMAPLVAQEDPAVGDGARVRITAPVHALRDRVGVVSDADPRRIVVSFENPGGGEITREIGRESIESLEVSARTGTHAWRGLGIGALIGGLSGAAIGFATYEADPCRDKFICWDFGPGGRAFGGAAIGAASVGVFGLVLGASMPSDEWVAVDPLPGSAGLAPTIGPSGPGLVLRWSVGGPDPRGR